MGWKEYYRQPEISPFGVNSCAYFFAINRLATVNPEILNPNESKTFVLGGFTHTNSSVNNFDYLCHQLHPHPKTVYLDLNHLPLTHIDPQLKIQAKLENLPLTRNSIDFLFLDFTQRFMDNQQLSQFFSQLPHHLKPNGLVLIANDYCIIPPPISSLLSKLTHHVPIHARSSHSLTKFSPLPCVLKGINELNEILVFAHPNSRLTTHHGNYYDLASDSIIDSWTLLNSKSVS